MGPAEYQEGVVITATELKKNLGKYLDFVEEYNEVVITKNGRKIARLTPYVTDFEQYLLIKERARDYQYGGKKVSYEEFMQIYEKSTLRMEFINGEIYLLSSPTVRHQDILGALHIRFSEYFKGKKCKVYVAPFDVHFKKKGIKEPDVMQPDLLVACDIEGNVNEKGKYMGTPTLTIEILSEGTRKKDMIHKLNTYSLSGVKEYWIIDTKQERVMVYEFEECETVELKVYEKGKVAQSGVFKGLEVDVRELFSGLL